MAETAAKALVSVDHLSRRGSRWQFREEEERRERPGRESELKREVKGDGVISVDQARIGEVRLDRGSHQLRQLSCGPLVVGKG